MVRCVAVWLLVLLVQCVRGMLRRMEEALRQGMVIPAVEYSDPPVTLAYRSSTEYNTRGMGNLYNVTRQFIHVVHDEKDPLPKGKCIISRTEQSCKLLSHIVMKFPTFYLSRMNPSPHFRNIRNNVILQVRFSHKWLHPNRFYDQNIEFPFVL
jgi:hypothetical protein